MGKCSRQVPSQRAALPAGKWGQQSHLEITRFLLQAKSEQKRSSTFASCSLAETQRLGAPLLQGPQPRAGCWCCQGWGRPPTDSWPGAASPRQACCTSVPAVFLGCCHSHFHPNGWLKPSKHRMVTVPPVTSPFQVMAVCTVSQPSSG